MTRRTALALPASITYPVDMALGVDSAARAGETFTIEQDAAARPAIFRTRGPDGRLGRSYNRAGIEQHVREIAALARRQISA